MVQLLALHSVPVTAALIASLPAHLFTACLHGAPAPADALPRIFRQQQHAASAADPAPQKPEAVAAAAAAAKKAPVPWGAFLRSSPVWAIIVAHFCFNWGYYTLLAWLPSYFELALGLNVQESSFLTLIP